MRLMIFFYCVVAGVGQESEVRLRLWGRGYKRFWVGLRQVPAGIFLGFISLTAAHKVTLSYRQVLGFLS